MKKRLPAVFAVFALIASASLSQAQFTIQSSPGTFTPSFRDGTHSDLGNTTYFGWGPGSFDGGTNNELMENPSPTLGVGGLDGTLNQVGTADILSGTNNLYIGTNGRTETLVLNVVTSGIVGLAGYTTLIIQGLTNSAAGYGNPSDLLFNYPVFGSINGVAPEFVIGLNASNYGQWWVKYELPGNQASYDINLTVTNTGGPTMPLTLTQLEVDTLYSATGYAMDTAAVPEPSTWTMLLAGVGMVTYLNRRRRHLVRLP